jgi:peptide/nickel transport system substrate-binding protein
VRRIVFDRTLGQKEAVELVKSGDGRVDLVTELSPLETLRVAQSPFATVVKNRGVLRTVFGAFNLRRTGSPWRDARLRQAVNLAVNRRDLIQYATRGNGVVIPALISAQDFGYDRTLPPFPFDPVKARERLREAGHPGGLDVHLIAPGDLEVQATVIGRMLEQVGFKVERQVLDPVAFNKRTFLAELERPPEVQAWDLALFTAENPFKFAFYDIYHYFSLGGPYDWVGEEPELRRLYEQMLGTVDQERQRALLQQMERHTRDQAYFLFLYSPVQLFAVSKAVQFEPHPAGYLDLVTLAVTDRHWSLRKGAPR